jgi:beta-mannosidase
MSLTTFLHDSHEKLLLQESWTVSRIDKNGKRDPDFSNIPATVPGCIHLDLMNAGKIPDPFKGLNEKEVAWVAESDWLYDCTFDLPGDWSAGDNVARRQLVAEGLDTFTEIFLDGKLFTETNNAFISHRFDLPPGF